MIVLLPPSETKAEPPRRGRPVDLTGLSFASLTPTRRSVCDALAAVSADPDALERLGVGASLEPHVRRNTELHTLPAVRVHDLYTGVLYDALGWPTLDLAARRRGARQLIVISALWGALRPGDRVPPYRLSMDVDLPGVGPLARAWRPALGAELEAAAGARGVVVDCRSATYAAAWAPAGRLAARTAAIRVLRENTSSASGERTVVSHLAKHTRGEVARHLLESGEAPANVPALAAILGRRWKVELTEPPRASKPWTLDLILTG